ncbi:Retinoid-inducible serine carboxypeptidase [Heterocephalus glaber]|uniref:Retinoid-inducible serine carboxypeptidase n=1 Tax=Heterocephalus glaber TaxID=10181 RepID=G5ARF7_HETGA|nr:Retinoid-inducible serine carboxypeptidase [Heterocephalus glaber]
MTLRVVREIGLTKHICDVCGGPVGLILAEIILLSWYHLAASLLFVDKPVGTGFSYVNTSDVYAKDLATMASDMLVLLKAFFNYHKEFQTFWILGTGHMVAADQGDMALKMMWLVTQQEWAALGTQEQTMDPGAL